MVHASLRRRAMRAARAHVHYTRRASRHLPWGRHTVRALGAGGTVPRWSPVRRRRSSPLARTWSHLGQVALLRLLGVLCKKSAVVARTYEAAGDSKKVTKYNQTRRSAREGSLLFFNYLAVCGQSLALERLWGQRAWGSDQVEAARRPPSERTPSCTPPPRAARPRWSCWMLCGRNSSCRRPF